MEGVFVMAMVRKVTWLIGVMVLAGVLGGSRAIGRPSDLSTKSLFACRWSDCAMDSIQAWSTGGKGTLRGVNRWSIDWQNGLLGIHRDTNTHVSFDDKTSYTELVKEAEKLTFDQRYEEATLIWKKILALLERRKGDQGKDALITLNSLSALYMFQGLYANAQITMRRALGLSERIHGPEHPATAVGLKLLGTLYLKQGNPDDAEPLLNRALSIHEKKLGPNNPETARSMISLGNLYVTQGKLVEAERLYMRTIKIRESQLHVNNTLELNQSLSNLAVLYGKQGNHAKATPLFSRVLENISNTYGNNHFGTSLALENLADNYKSQGLHNRAEPLYEQALTIRETLLGPDNYGISGLLKKLADVNLKKDLFDKASNLYYRAENISLVYIQRESAYLASLKRLALKNTKLPSYPLDVISVQGTGGARLALFISLNRKSLIAEIEKRQSLLSSVEGSEIKKKLGKVIQQLALSTNSPEERKRLNGYLERLEENFFRVIPELRPRVIEVEQVASVLPTNSALLEFQRYQPSRGGLARYLVTVLKPGGSIAAVDLGPAVPLEKLIHQALRASEQNEVDASTLWAEVSRSILTPLATATRDAKVLFLSPDGELNRVPFAALPAPGSSQVLSETVQLRLITTGRDLLNLQQPSGAPKGVPLVVAHPRFDAPGQPSGVPLRGEVAIQQRSADLNNPVWSPLPATAREGQAIASLTNARLLVQEQATAAAVQQQLSPKILHIASHAFFLADQPQKAEPPAPASLTRSGSNPLGFPAANEENPLLRSGIALAGANAPAASNTDDGYLMALEIARLDWKGTELVVISGCESGKGVIQTGEGVYGLRRAIAVAGARSSLLSLWKVDDAATADFMTRYYRRLKAGVGRADALAAVQAEFRNGTAGNGQWKEPYYWAAWQLVGDWRPMQKL
jgi:CHAT domain-containing protein/tetratricopeptide (TPR) repeat protein